MDARKREQGTNGYKYSNKIIIKQGYSLSRVSCSGLRLAHSHQFKMQKIIRIICNNIQNMQSKDWEHKKIKANEEDDSNKNEDDDGGDDDLDDFLDDDEDVDDSYVRGPLDDDYSSDEGKKNKKKHKNKKKSKKSKKKKQSYSEDEEYDEIEDLLEEKHLNRLRKNKVRERAPSDEDEEDDYRDQDRQSQREYEQPYQREQYSSEEYSRPNQVQYEDKQDIIDIIDNNILIEHFQTATDKQIIEYDLPERKYEKIINYCKVEKVPIEKAKQDFVGQDRTAEAKWIYEKLRQQSSFDMHDEKICRQQILNVLNVLHKENLQMMYIYYYRKKLWQDALNLNLLMKIDEMDAEWMSFKKQYNKLKSKILFVIESFQEVPLGINEALQSCTELRMLKYFQDYVNFVMSKRNPTMDVKSFNKKYHVIRQVCQKNIDQWIEKAEVFLSPQKLCLNFRNRVQDKKPKTPSIQPDAAIRQVLKKHESENAAEKSKEKNDEDIKQGDDENKEWISTPLLSPEKRIVTICNYLALQLFNYPELRKILKQKYYKKLIISTLPTTKGAQDINLYSPFFPVKRIKEKPVSSLKKQIWILACEAEQKNLIKIELKFEWELSAKDQKNFQSDSVYLEMVKYYFDLSTHSSGEVWNLFRKQVLIKMLTDYFFPSFLEEVKEDLTREGHKEVIDVCCEKFRKQLRKGSDSKPLKILAMVLQNEKLGIAFVDEHGKSHAQSCMPLFSDEDLKKFVADQIIYKLIQEHNPDMILVSANCRRAQTLRKQLRSESLFPQAIFCAFGQYEIPSLIANKNKISGKSDEKAILTAISMARLKKNPMAQILSLWSENHNDNGVLSMNFHPLQKHVNKAKLAESLKRVAIEAVNVVGLNINEVLNSDHYKNQLQFICGLGARKAHDLLEKIKTENKNKITSRKQLQYFLPGLVKLNCAPFLRVETDEHREFMEKVEKDQKIKNTYEDIKLLDMTRIPQEWYGITEKLFLQAVRSSNLLELKQKKSMLRFSDETIALIEIFKHPEKLRMIEWDNRKEECPFYDEALVKSEIINRFNDPRGPEKEKIMETKEIFYSLLKSTPETLKKYMVVTAKIMSVHNQSLNVVMPENGLFGNIKINETRPEYEKGNFIKAIITGFPFDERKNRERSEDNQELLKVEMALSFPHKSEDRNHDCFDICFPSMVKEIHPNIDLDRGVFELRREDMPIVEVREEAPRPMNTYRKISHPNFKNITISTAIEQVRGMPVGNFIIRPSTEGPDFLTITWHFYKNVIAHIKLKAEQKNVSSLNFVYRVLDKDRQVYSSIEQVIERHIKPMNALVQDIISNKKFLPLTIEQIEEKVKTQIAKDPSYIHYFFGCSPQFPQFFILIYIYKEKRPTKELIRIRSPGLFFHDQCFQSLRQLIAWFKEHLKEKEYQRYARTHAIKK